MTLIDLVSELRRMIPQNGETQTRWNETMALCDAIVDKACWENWDHYMSGLKDGMGTGNDIPPHLTGEETSYDQKTYRVVEK